MAHDEGQVRARAPWHFWVVGVLAVLWNAIGAVDYVMSRTHNAGYFTSVMPEVSPQVIFAYNDNMPLLAAIGWGFGVWGAVAGTLLLLARSRHAVPAYLSSLVGAIVSFAYQFTSYKPPAAMADPIFPIIITLIALALVLYAQRMWARGVLR